MKCFVNDLPAYYEQYGEGQPILCIHGYCLDHRIMVGCLEPIFKNLTGYCRVYLDLPGMGNTPSNPLIKNADDMLEVLDWVNIPLTKCIYLVYTIFEVIIMTTTTIQKWGNSQGVRLPKPVLEEINLKENEVLEVIVESDGIFLKKINKPREHKTLQQRFEEFYGKDIDTITKEDLIDYQPEEIDWGKPVGKEVW